jgi:hypothetical protein
MIGSEERLLLASRIQSCSIVAGVVLHARNVRCCMGPGLDDSGLRDKRSKRIRWTSLQSLFSDKAGLSLCFLYCSANLRLQKSSALLYCPGRSLTAKPSVRARSILLRILLQNIAADLGLSQRENLL